MNRSVLIVALLSAASSFAQSKSPCFAFLLRADVTIVCHGKTSQITHRRDIEDFAVSDELSSLAYVTSVVTPLDKDRNEVHSKTSVINLGTGDTKQVAGIEGIVSTCGGILPNQIGPGTSTRDVVTDEEVQFPPFVRFRCSSDRRVVAGITSEGSRDQMSDLYVGHPPAVKIAAAADVYVHFFNISPDGSKIAWFNDTRPLCVYSGPGSSRCVEHATIADPVSVNDSGEALVATGNGRGCVYKSPTNFRPARLGAGDDECLGIGYWKPGMKSIVFLEAIGRTPQWIKPETAELLRRWSARKNTGR